ncbi:MAG: SulP family inorganic anion transporter [Magnetococcales bacterium]|nr:SulP family inorganic anion transporter [Magnetococcales bacterium]
MAITLDQSPTRFNPFLWIADQLRARKATFKDDLVAGVTVSLVAIPQSLAYAQLAGVPAYYGLYAGFIPTIIGALFGSSAQLSTGPVAMTSLLTAASIAPLAPKGSETYISLVVLLALLSGVFQVALGALRVGVLLNFLSHPVLMGFINAAALIIGLAQFPTLLGIVPPHADFFMMEVGQTMTHIADLNGYSLAFGMGAIVMLVMFKRFAPRWPGVLLTVASLTIVSKLTDYAHAGNGAIVGAIPSGLPGLSVPPLNIQEIITLIVPAFVIALISFMEAMSSARIISIKTRIPWDENRELIGQGLAKIAAAFCYSMPVSGSFSRSALNLATNARTSLSSIISALSVLLTLMFFTASLYHLPKPVLAAIIMMAVAGLFNFNNIKRAWKINPDDGLAGGVTFVTTLIFAPNIQNGIMIGIVLSLILVQYRMMRPRVVKDLGLLDGCILRDAVNHDLPRLHPRLGTLRFDGALRFMNVSYFENAILDVERLDPEIRYILVQGDGINALDASGVEMLISLVERLRGNNIHLAFSSLKYQAFDVFRRSGLTKILGEENLFANDRDAVDTLLARLGKAA